jgi:CBS domain containing-hemolysin-like protein
VYEGTLDHILGFVHIKDMIWILLDRARRAEDHQPLAEFNLRSVLRDALIVPETKPVSELLLEFRARRTGLAMIVDEFGSILGLATLEDILEQMVGEIHDEFDVVERPLTLPDGGMIFDAAIKIRELAARYNIILPEDPSYETVGGFVLTRLGFIPRGSESFEADGYRFTVMEMDHRRVSRLKIKPLPPAIVPSQSPAPKAEEAPRPEQQDASTEHDAPAEVLQMPLPISAAESRGAKKNRRATRKKSSKPLSEGTVSSPDEPAPDSPSSGPAHK